MAVINDLYRINITDFSFTYRGTSATTSRTYTIDYSGEPSGVNYTGWTFGLNYAFSGSCTSVLTVNFSDGTKITLTLSTGTWNELYHTVKPVSFFITTTGKKKNQGGTVSISSIIDFEFYNYTIPDTASLVYSLQNQQFDGVDDYIDTNIQLFSQNFNWIVFLDFTSAPTLNNVATILHCLVEEEPYPGTGVDYGLENGRLIGKMYSDIKLFDTSLAGNHHKAAIRRKGRYFSYVVPGKEVIDYTDLMEYRLFDNTAILGANVLTDGTYARFWEGTIHSCKIWSGYMSDEDFAALMDEPVNPVINILSQDKEIISDEAGHDTCTITFQSNKDLTYWEARATSSGSPFGHGVGILVESGESLAAGATGTVYVDDEELTNGDLLYRIDIWGRDANGNWNEIKTNLFDPDTDITEIYNITLNDNGIYIIDCDGQNTSPESAYFKLQFWNGIEFINEPLHAREPGNYSYTFTKDITFDKIRLGLNGNNADATIHIINNKLVNGKSYTLSFELISLGMNSGEFTGLEICEV